MKWLNEAYKFLNEKNVTGTLNFKTFPCQTKETKELIEEREGTATSADQEAESRERFAPAYTVEPLMAIVDHSFL
jgi:hypothetical protein